MAILRIYKIAPAISAIIFVAAVVMLFVYGLQLGADFTGGSVLEVSFAERPVISDVRTTLQSLEWATGAQVAETSDNGVIVKLGELTEEQHQATVAALSDAFGEATELRFDSIGPTIGSELKSKSITAIIVLLVLVILYIVMVFRSMSLVLSPWALGFAAVVALIHDVVITLGALAVLSTHTSIEITAVFVAAILTILGYSMNDTVVVFDRIRENVQKFGSRKSFPELTHQSIKETLGRSINTSFTTLLSLVAIAILGGVTLRPFALALIIGLGLGTYSSILIASPVLMWWHKVRSVKRGS